MCGILATINIETSSKKFLKALRLMEHRGPDNTSYINHNNHYFGHTRLSILDLSDRSNQPFISGDYLIIYNGEVYNYQELIKEHDLNMDTTSDTEVVLKMYMKYGVKALDYFNGMFAFIIFNTKSKDVFVARDRLGIKPLYYRKLNDGFIFSSEIASILEMFNDDFDEFGIRQYKKLRMTLKGHTFYKNTKMFPAGHYFLNGQIHKYWELNYSPKDPISDEELKWLIEDSVKIRRRSDVPVGSYLSGGLDSTILSYILDPDHTWTVGFDDLNEFEWSQLAADNLHGRHHKTVVNAEFTEE